MEFLKLLWIRAVTYFYESVEFLQVVFLFYPNKSFRQQDLSLLKKYIFTNPFTVSKKYLLSLGAKDLYQYGETPLTTFAKIVKECGITSTDRVYELGCGRARTCFWLAAFVKCRVLGIEQIPIFVEKANEVKNAYSVANVEFYLGSYYHVSFKNATVIYLYGTCLQTDEIERLLKKFAKMPLGAKVITVSYPLTDYVGGELFDLVHSFEASYPWGTATLYVHVRIMTKEPGRAPSH